VLFDYAGQFRIPAWIPELMLSAGLFKWEILLFSGRLVCGGQDVWKLPGNPATIR